MQSQAEQHSNLHYDELLRAAHYNCVIRDLELEPIETDDVAAMVKQVMLKKLRATRDALINQGAGGINDSINRK